MKLAIFSDLHLGFGQGTERFEESFENASKAFDLAVQEKADAVLLAGDIFDSDVPSQETWEKAFKVFSRPKRAKSSLEIKRTKEGKEETIECSRLPIIAIHGTHEFRGRDFKNALEVLEAAGFLVYLHAATAEFNGIAVHGLGGVPEKKALDALKLWNPKPTAGKKNILLMHQSIREFLPFDDDMIASISLSDLPQGFDLIVDGHMHWASEEHVGERNFLVTGSTIITQMKKLESGKSKGVFLVETDSMHRSFLELPNQRKFFYEKIEFKSASAEQVKEAVEEKLHSLLQKTFSQKPLVRLKLAGSIAKGLSASDIDLSEIEHRFSGKCLLGVSKTFAVESLKKKLDELKELQKSKKSIAALGLELLDKNLSETAFNNAFDARRVFELLAGNKIDEVVKILSEKRSE